MGSPLHELLQRRLLPNPASTIAAWTLTSPACTRVRPIFAEMIEGRIVVNNRANSRLQEQQRRLHAAYGLAMPLARLKETKDLRPHHGNLIPAPCGALV